MLLRQGTAEEHSYNFTHWQYIDIFCYFSHNLVTVPPPTWVAAAHQHGVKVIGTLIAEHDAGRLAISVLLGGEQDEAMPRRRLRRGRFAFNAAETQVAEHAAPSAAAALQLARLAAYYGFDGWLVNIECPLHGIAQASQLLSFVTELRNQMHMAVPGSLVIWCGAVPAHFRSPSCAFSQPASLRQV